MRGAYGPGLSLPLIPCSDAAGVVTEVRPGTDPLVPGDRVCTHMVPDWHTGRLEPQMRLTTLGRPSPGVLCDERVLPRNAVVRIPDSLSFEEAACLPVAGLAAWSALTTEASIGPGARVLLQGTGGLSLLGLQIRRPRGRGGSHLLVGREARPASRDRGRLHRGLSPGGLGRAGAALERRRGGRGAGGRQRPDVRQVGKGHPRWRMHRLARSAGARRPCGEPVRDPFPADPGTGHLRGKRRRARALRVLRGGQRDQAGYRSVFTAWRPPAMPSPTCSPVDTWERSSSVWPTESRI